MSLVTTNLRRLVIAKNQNTFAKMEREKQKRRKAEVKRQRRLERKAGQVKEAHVPNCEIPNGPVTIQANDSSTIKNEMGDDLSITDD